MSASLLDIRKFGSRSFLGNKIIVKKQGFFEVKSSYTIDYSIFQLFWLGVVKKNFLNLKGKDLQNVKSILRLNRNATTKEVLGTLATWINVKCTSILVYLTNYNRPIDYEEMLGALDIAIPEIVLQWVKTINSTKKPLKVESLTNVTLIPTDHKIYLKGYNLEDVKINTDIDLLSTISELMRINDSLNLFEMVKIDQFKDLFKPSGREYDLSYIHNQDKVVVYEGLGLSDDDVFNALLLKPRHIFDNIDILNFDKWDLNSKEFNQLIRDWVYKIDRIRDSNFDVLNEYVETDFNLSFSRDEMNNLVSDIDTYGSVNQDKYNIEEPSGGKSKDCIESEDNIKVPYEISENIVDEVKAKIKNIGDLNIQETQVKLQDQLKYKLASKDRYKKGKEDSSIDSNGENDLNSNDESKKE